MKKKISILIAIFIGVSLFFVKISASGEFMMTFGKSDLPDDSILLSNNSTYELSFLLSNDDKKWQRLLLRSNKSAVISYREKGGTKYKQYYIKIDSGKHPKHFVLAINMRYGVYWDDHFKSWQVIHSGAN